MAKRILLLLLCLGLLLPHLPALGEEAAPALTEETAAPAPAEEPEASAPAEEPEASALPEAYGDYSLVTATDTWELYLSEPNLAMVLRNRETGCCWPPPSTTTPPRAS